MDCKAFINKVEKIISEQENKDRATGAAFNLLEIAHINRDEVRICRILHSIINPKGEHLMEDKFFKIFANNVLGLKDDEIGHPEVTREEHTDNNRRADIFIKTDKWLIPIEVKIDAEDQYEQCYDYYWNAKNNAENKNVRVFYLTKDGKHPAEWSSNKLSIGDKNADTDIRCISFREDICAFIDRCLKDSQINERLKISFEILRDAIKGFCNYEPDKTRTAVMELIKRDEDHFKAAIAIAEDESYISGIVRECVNEIGNKLIKDYIDKVEKKLNEILTCKVYRWKNDLYWDIPNCCLEDGFRARYAFIIYPNSEPAYKGEPVIGVQIMKNNDKLEGDALKRFLKDNPQLKKISKKPTRINWIRRESLRNNLKKDIHRDYTFNSNYNYTKIGEDCFKLLTEPEMDIFAEKTLKFIMDFAEKDIEAKLDEADRLAAASDKRLSHDEVFVKK